MSDYQLENRKKINDKIKGNYLMYVFSYIKKFV